MTSQGRPQSRLLVIDDRSENDQRASSGPAWRLITDRVMGGVSSGRLDSTEIAGRACLCMHGQVSLDNNGGFVQIGLDLAQGRNFDASGHTGVLLDIYGNGETYNVHLRTAALSKPWQSYRASFRAPPEWQTVALPFRQFRPHRVNSALDLALLTRIGLVAIGREFTAHLCVARIALY